MEAARKYIEMVTESEVRLGPRERGRWEHSGTRGRRRQSTKILKAGLCWPSWWRTRTFFFLRLSRTLETYLYNRTRPPPSEGIQTSGTLEPAGLWGGAGVSDGGVDAQILPTRVREPLSWPFTPGQPFRAWDVWGRPRSATKAFSQCCGVSVPAWWDTFRRTCNQTAQPRRGCPHLAPLTCAVRHMDTRILSHRSGLDWLDVQSAGGLYDDYHKEPYLARSLSTVALQQV